MDRRTWLAAVTAGVLTACASVVTTPVTPEAGRIRLVLRDYPWLARPGGSLKIRPVGDHRVFYVLALDDGEFATVSPICKHLGCTVNIEVTQLVCPCHGSTYGRDGRLLRGPAAAPLDRFPTTRSADGVIVIELGGGTV